MNTSQCRKCGTPLPFDKARCPQCGYKPLSTSLKVVFVIGGLMSLIFISDGVSAFRASSSAPILPRLFGSAIPIVMAALFFGWAYSVISKHKGQKGQNSPDVAILSGIAQPSAENTKQKPLIIRLYEGNEAEAFAAYRLDASLLAGQGYAPTTQNWIPGQWGGGAIFIAILLCFCFGIGFFVIIYMLIVKPRGKLSVTYTPAHSAAT